MNPLSKPSAPASEMPNPLFVKQPAKDSTTSQNQAPAHFFVGDRLTPFEQESLLREMKVSSEHLDKILAQD